MDFMDEAKKLAQQGEQLAKEHPDTVNNLVDKAEATVDSATGNQHTTQIEEAGNKLEGLLEQ